MDNEDALIKRVMHYVKLKAKRREIVMFGYHPAVQEKLTGAGIKVSSIFTGNLDLLERKELNCHPALELNGKSRQYYVIIPFFLSDGGAAQRNSLQSYGFKEFKDYVFFPEEEASIKKEKKELTKADAAVLVEEVKKLQELVSVLQKKINTVQQENMLKDAQNKLLLWFAASKQDEDMAATKKRFFQSIPRASGTLRAMQQAGIILLAKLDEVCRKNNIPYWISFGTLLGAIRHQGFIPWDDDTDICMLRTDAMRLTELMKDDEDFYVSHIFAEFDDNLNHCVQFKYRKEATPYCLDIFIYDYCENLMQKNVLHQMKLNRELAEEAQTVRKKNLTGDKKYEKYSEIINRYLEKSKKEVGTTDIPTDYMIWALDNYRCEEFMQGNCVMEEVFPLRRIQFEGIELMAPNSMEQYVEKKYGDIYSLPDDMFSHSHFKLNQREEKILFELLEKHKKYLKGARL